MRRLALALPGDVITPAAVVTRRHAADGRRHLHDVTRRVADEVTSHVLVVLGGAGVGVRDLEHVRVVLGGAHLLHLKNKHRWNSGTIS